MKAWLIMRKGIYLNRFLEKRMIMVVGSGIILGAIFHNTIIALKPVVSFIFAYMTLAIALGSSSRDFLNALRRPWLYGAILAGLHLLLPLIALTLSRFFLSHAPFLQAGIILGTAIPIGVASTIWVNIARGNAALSLSAVILDTILSPLIVPAVILFTIGTAVEFDALSLVSGLTLMVVVPTIIGVLLNDLTKGTLKRKIGYITGPSTKILLALVIATNMGAAWGSLQLLTDALGLVMGLTFAVSCSGYLLGYGLAKVLRLPSQLVNTFIFTIGMRNITAGLVMALNYFPEVTAIPVVFMIMFQQPLAALSHRFLTERKPIKK